MLFVEESHNEPRNMNFIKEVFSTMKKYFEDSINNDLVFRSQLASKDPSKKKLQLTIKSLSQKNLTVSHKSSETPRKGIK